MNDASVIRGLEKEYEQKNRRARYLRDERVRELFEKYYPGQAGMIAGYWMPNPAWPGCAVDDPSARVLANYGDSGK